MLKIRLRRMGARNRPYYRIVVSDSRQTSRAEVLEELGHYDPVGDPPRIVLNRERACDRKGSRSVSHCRVVPGPARASPGCFMRDEARPEAPTMRRLVETIVRRLS